jgi:hypothetical protein
MTAKRLMMSVVSNCRLAALKKPSTICLELAVGSR